MKSKIKRLEEKLRTKGEVPKNERLQVVGGSPEEVEAKIQEIKARLFQEYGTTCGVAFVRTNIDRRPKFGEFKYALDKG